MADIIRKHLHFTGWVQGVGFRWRARHAAGAAGTTGWVRNEADGSVTMELQGEPERIDRVIQMIEQGRYIQIASIDARTVPVLPDERGFSVRDDRW